MSNFPVHLHLNIDRNFDKVHLSHIISCLFDLTIFSKFSGPKSRKRKNNAAANVAPLSANTVNATMFMVQDNDDDSDAELAAVAAARGGEFHICRICNQFVPVGQLAAHNHEHHSAISDLTCTDCGKLFKSKRSLFGHRKEKHSGKYFSSLVLIFSGV